MPIPLDVFGDRRSAGESQSPMLDVKPENIMMAAAEMHRMGRFETLKPAPQGKAPTPLPVQRGKLK